MTTVSSRVPALLHALSTDTEPAAAGLAAPSAASIRSSSSTRTTLRSLTSTGKPGIRLSAGAAEPARVVASVSTNKRYSAESNRQAYDRIYTRLSRQYVSFNPVTEIGHNGSAGITSGIKDIGKQDIIGAMMHIRDTAVLLDNCKKNSRRAPFFDKFYLMSHPTQGWNLRAHFFNAKGSGLGGEDSPHFHRWTLASRVLTGGYYNRTYREAPLDNQATEGPRHIYDKYRLAPTKNQGNQNSRPVERLGEALVVPADAQLYDKDSLNHFPVETPHSVQALASHFGTTVTFAHTSKAQKEASISYKKPKELGSNLTELKEIRCDADPEFLTHFNKAIAFLQVVQLQEDLQSFIAQKWETGNKPTPHEQAHQYDSYERNYVETSLLSSLAIYQMEQANGVPHREFAPDTCAFLDKELAHILPDGLKAVIEQNQSNLFDQVFSLDVMDDVRLKQLLDKEFIDGLDQRS